jgi:alkaline phosphatase
MLRYAVRLAVFLTVPLSSACSAGAQEGAARVILFVADGAGAGHWTAARLTIEDPAFVRLPTVGLIDTRGSDHTVTESAASASAYATGVRTQEHMISLGPDSMPRRTVLELAAELGRSTGLITTTRLTDATPAAFCAHYDSRNHAEVAKQMAAAGVTVLMGGGRAWFWRVMDEDSTRLLQRLQADYAYVETDSAFRDLDSDTLSNLVGLFADRDMALAPERAPTLAAMTETALAILDRNPRGFFLMVESEETDTQAHDNEPFEVLARELRAFDDAVRIGLEYQRRHPETLIVVLGDHETGGLSIVTGRDGRPEARYTTTGHTAAMLPVFAGGPGADQFGGIIPNSRVGELLMEAIDR